jgi:Na+-driven multidrug efflux pump
MKKNVDMTVGNPTKLLVWFMIPLILNYVFQQFYAVGDSAIVALALGSKVVTGVNVTGSLSFLVLGFSQGCSGGFGVLMSQFVGAKDEERQRKSFATSIILTIVIATVLTALSLTYSRELLVLMKTNEIYIGYAEEYIRAIFSGIVFTMFYNLASQILLAHGDSKSPLIILIVSAVLNVLLNCLLFVTDWSVAWAGWATVISQGIAAIVGFVLIVKKIPTLRLKKSDFCVNVGFVFKHLGMGLPMACQYSITAFGCMIQQRAFNLFDPKYAMAQSTGSKISGLFDSGALQAFGTAIGTYFGQNYGAKRLDRLQEGLKKGFLVGAVTAVASSLLVIALAYPLSWVLLPDASKEIYDLVFFYDFVHGVMYVFLALIYFFRHALQGIGQSVCATLGGVVELIARVVCANTLAKIAFEYACFSNPSAWLTAGLFLMIVFLFFLQKLKKENFR